MLTRKEFLFTPDIFITEDILPNSSVDFDFEERKKQVERKQYVASGICSVAFNRKRGIFAIADSYFNPKIRIFNSQTFEQLRILSGGAVSEFYDMDFSREGDKLVSLSGIPDHMIRVWDWEKGKM